MQPEMAHYVLRHFRLHLAYRESKLDHDRWAAMPASDFPPLRGDDAMKIEIEVSEVDATLVETFLKSAAGSQCNSHGPLDFPRLASMLLEDVALMVRRPGSWEGANMAQVLGSHGYEC